MLHLHLLLLKERVVVQDLVVAVEQDLQLWVQAVMAAVQLLVLLLLLEALQLVVVEPEQGKRQMQLELVVVVFLQVRRPVQSQPKQRVARERMLQMVLQMQVQVQVEEEIWWMLVVVRRQARVEGRQQELEHLLQLLQHPVCWWQVEEQE